MTLTTLKGRGEWEYGISTIIKNVLFVLWVMKDGVNLCTVKQSFCSRRKPRFDNNFFALPQMNLKSFWKQPLVLENDSYCSLLNKSGSHSEIKAVVHILDIRAGRVLWGLFNSNALQVPYLCYFFYSTCCPKRERRYSRQSICGVQWYWLKTDKEIKTMCS